MENGKKAVLLCVHLVVSINLLFNDCCSFVYLANLTNFAAIKLSDYSQIKYVKHEKIITVICYY